MSPITRIHCLMPINEKQKPSIISAPIIFAMIKNIALSNKIPKPIPKANDTNKVIAVS